MKFRAKLTRNHKEKLCIPYVDDDDDEWLSV